jgi:hypothetical protein
MNPREHYALLLSLAKRAESTSTIDRELDRLYSHHVKYAPQPDFHLVCSLQDEWDVERFSSSVDAALEEASRLNCFVDLDSNGDSYRAVVGYPWKPPRSRLYYASLVEGNFFTHCWARAIISALLKCKAEIVKLENNL